MLKKLIKHDMRAVYKRALPIYAGIGGVALVCCALMFFTMGFSDTEMQLLISGIALSIYYIGIFAIVILSLVASYFPIERYYSSMFTNEGALTMTIPEKTSKIVNSKIAVILIFNGITSLICSAALTVAILPALMFYVPSQIMSSGLVHALSFLFFRNESLASVAVVSNLILSLEFSITVVTAITAGSVNMPKNKILGSFLFYFIISLAVSFAKNLMYTAVYVFASPRLSEYKNVLELVTDIMSMATSILICVVLYFISLRILKNKFTPS